MNADHLAYKRATSVSLLGLTVQLVLGLVVLIYGILGSDSAAISGAYLMLIGTLVWGALALVFNQHRLERLEALEIESYKESKLAEASVFEEDARGHRVQTERLAWMHKWLLPIVSVVVAALLLGLGFILLGGHTSLISSGQMPLPPYSGWGIAIGVGLAAVGFVFARFVAGMAKQPAWLLLHGGAGVGVAASLVGLALALGHFLVAVDVTDVVLRYLPAALDIFLIALGIEVVLNFMLGAYRPRKPGEYMRPAFDSRVLAFVAAPDRIAQSINEAVNYQFGFDVSSTWFYRLLARSTVILIVLGVAVGWLLSSLHVVEPDERALVLRNGRLTEASRDGESVAPGLVVGLPWPMSQVIRFPASALNQLEIGDIRDTAATRPILWTAERNQQLAYFVVRSGERTGSNGLAPTDFALLSVEVPLQYRVEDLTRYISLAQDAPPIFDEELGRRRDDPERFRRELLKSVATEVVWRELSGRTVDEVLGADRLQVAEEIEQTVQERFDELAGGRAVNVVFVGLVGAAPEAETAKAFELVVTADSQRQARLETARAQEISALAEVAGTVEQGREIIRALQSRDDLLARGASEEELEALEQRIIDLIEASGGEASELIEQARADRWQRALDPRQNYIRAEGQGAAYAAAPQLFRLTRQLEMLRDVAANARVWITPFDVEIDNREGIESQVNLDGILDENLGGGE